MGEIYSVNGLVPENIYYNGADADSVWQNGEMVWERGGGGEHYRIDFLRIESGETFSDYAARVMDEYPEYDMAPPPHTNTLEFGHPSRTPRFRPEPGSGGVSWVLPWASNEPADDSISLAIGSDTYNDFHYVVGMSSHGGYQTPKMSLSFSGVGLNATSDEVLTVEIDSDGSVTLIDGDSAESKGIMPVPDINLSGEAFPVHVTYIDGELRVFYDDNAEYDTPIHTNSTTLEVTSEDVDKKGGRSCRVDFTGNSLDNNVIPPGIFSMEAWTGVEARVNSPAWNHEENRWKNVMMQTITESGVYNCPEGYDLGYGVAYGAGGSGSCFSSNLSSVYGGGYAGTTSPFLVDPRDGSFTVECGEGGAPVGKKYSNTSGNAGSATKISSGDKELASPGGGDGGDTSGSSNAGGQSVPDFDFFSRHWPGAQGGASSAGSSDGEPGSMGSGGGGGRAAFSSSIRRSSGKGGDGGAVICWLEA